MASVRRIRAGEWQLFKRIRLASLRESPSAFGATYESARLRTDAGWAEQADGTAQGSDRATFIAFSGAWPVAIAALYRTQHDPRAGELLQVWVSPERRGQGVAGELLDAVFEWAGENGFQTVVAAVARDNETALSFYRKYGFVPSNGFALDHDPGKTVVLSKRVGPAPAIDAHGRAPLER